MESKKITLESILNDEKAPAKFVTNELSMVNRSTQALEKETLKFSKEELAQIETIKNEIDVKSSSDILQYGGLAQKNIASFSDSILNKVKTKDSGEVGAILVDLVGKINEFDSSSSTSNFLRKIPVIGALVGKSEKMMAQYQSVSSQIEKISITLDKNRILMLNDIEMFDEMYQQNNEYFKNLNMYITAGEEKLAELENEVLPRLKEEAIQANDSMSAQAVSDYENAVARFSKRLYDLKLSKTIAIQTAPQIRLIQNNNRMLYSKIQSAVCNTIPLWKNQTVIAIGLSRQENVLKVQRELTNMTNNLLTRNAELLHQNSVQTTKENERGIVDIETLKKVNQELVNTIKETLQVQQQSREARTKAEQEIVQIESQLKETLLSSMNNQSSVYQTPRDVFKNLN